MGVVTGITATDFPRQSEWLHRRVEVCFNYDTANRRHGTIIRDDVEEPYRMIIRLDDGRHVLATECQYSLSG